MRWSWRLRIKTAVEIVVKGKLKARVQAEAKVRRIPRPPRCARRCMHLCARALSTLARAPTPTLTLNSLQPPAPLAEALPVCVLRPCPPAKAALTPPSLTSDVSPHTSHTSHLSHLTPLTSHLSSHTSHLSSHTSNLSPLASHLPPLTCVLRSCPSQAKAAARERLKLPPHLRGAALLNETL